MSTTILNNPPTAVRIGRVWFQGRSFSPLPFFVLFFLLKPDFVPTSFEMVALTIVVIAAEAIRVWAVGYAGSATRTRGDSVPELVLAGPYLRIRNPLYVGNILMYTAAGLMFGQIYLSIAFFFYSCVQYTFIVRYEENILENIFGPSYASFKAVVPRWFPKRKKLNQRSSHQFSLVKAIVSEKSTFYSLAAAGLLLWIKHVYQIGI